MILTEKQFETDIEHSLLTKGGYIKGNPKAFDCKTALDTETLLTFVKTTQSKSWEKYQSIYGTSSEKSFIERFCKEVKTLGLLNVLRHGFKDRGITFRTVYWKPETSINKTAQEQYERNILHCTRQLHYSPNNENSIDIVLFVNGIPVVSMELKNQFTGQDADNAIHQYKFDRSGKETIFEFKNRVLVHFAVDLYNVFMTTRLQGANTYFLPFNQGSNGAGNVGGKGNPQNPDGYQTAYLWEKILTKDSLLEILHKYMHLQADIHEDKNGNKIKKETMIFPRYHQIDVVTKLIADVKEKGAGQNYLIQHSAGSGKSNSIAWLAHRLSGLHNSIDEKIFRSVIVVTDRKVLDSQLQDTIYQFDHVDGVVQKIDKNAAQLKDAIESGAPIIITTLQKFPVIYKEVMGQKKNFAIIVDEAHSSQTGEAAKKLKKALADTDQVLDEYARMENEAEDDAPDSQDKILNELAAQGQHDNLSFFAFTATPKDKTLQMFGTQTGDGKYVPFHIYSMKQAIEEKFILDVLKNYVTYKNYYKIIKTISDDPQIETSSGVKAIKRYESLHPHNIAQKTAIMIEHFREVTKKQIGGKAKAMVVTASRLHAVRYFNEFKRYIKEHGYNDLDVLVAFSGEINDNDESYTEEKMNGIKENQLKSAFHGDEYSMLIVAEKYQTGFDEPLLHTMFVDKKLSGVKAVQTLSRLNRTTRGKDSTFVLDFVNTAEDIQKSFEPYYEATVLDKATDPNVLYDIKNTLDSYRIYTTAEIEKFAELFFASDEHKGDALGKLSSILIPAHDRYLKANDEDANIFRTTLARFNRIYGFISQICRMFDRDLHKFSVYAKFLYKVLPKEKGPFIFLDDKILMEYYKLEKEFEGSISLESSEGGLGGIKGEAGAK
ncbi:MAG: DEAD/DEAH box helicase family protein, partial [Ruminiclostridium sp.]|nr:DEAD/DEAH box helicase family protein [Ruminiclostridium sp.]